MAKEKHITILGVLYIVRGALILLLGLVAFVVLTGIGALSGDNTALGILGFIGTAAMTLMLVLSLPSIIAGIGLLKHHEWGRVMAIIVGCISLVDFPIGTALGVYTLIILLDDEAIAVFRTQGSTVSSLQQAGPAGM